MSTCEKNKKTVLFRKSGTMLCIALFLAGSTVFAQATGSISGTILDSADGQPIIGAVAQIKELGLYGASDMDGNYRINNVPEGSHKVTYQMSGYQTAVDTVKVTAGKNSRNNIAMSFKIQEEMVVTAKRVSNTAASLLTKQKKAAAAQDAISSEQISKSPDNDAADAAKRVTGVSVVGNGNIFIRGMSDRYSVVQVNQALVPSPIPTRRTVPLDIFPVALLDNMTIVKTYLASYQGEFGAGVIDIETKDYPEEEEIKVGMSVGMNTITTFKTFGTYKGGSLDFLGYDDGGRSIPDSIKNTKVAPYSTLTQTGFTNPQLLSIAQKFSNVWSRENTNAIPAGKLQASYGKTYELENGKKLGIIRSTFFQQQSQTQKGVFKRYLADKSEAADYRYEDFSYSTAKSAQIGATYAATNASKYKVNSFYTHKSNDTTRQNIGQYDYSKVGTKTILSFWDASLLFNQLIGEHKIGFLDSEVRWFANGSFAWRNQPDTRATRYTDLGVFDQTRNMTRYFNNHFEQMYQTGGSIDIPFQQWSGLKSKFTLGADVSTRLRETSSRRFTHDLQVIGDLTRSAEYIFKNMQPRIVETTGTSAAEGFDAYDASLLIAATYAQVDMPIVSGVRFIGGVRAEGWQQKADSFNLFDADLREENSLQAVNVMPALSIVYSPTDNTNLRVSGSQTINRPDFIEASNFRLFDDLVTGAVLKGNPNLTYATITSGDVRLEYFPGVGEIIAVSGFYKHIKNPIEASVGALADDLQFSYVNQAQAELLGGEFEIRKNFSFIHDSLKYLSFLTNLTLIHSEIKFSTDIFTAETNNQRPLQGQSPWLFNTGLFWDYETWGTSIGTLYNIFGRRIVNVGVNGLPNTYEESYGVLDVVAKQTLGKGLDLKLTASNLLDPEIVQNQGTGKDKQLVESYHRGINISASVNYTF